MVFSTAKLLLFSITLCSKPWTNERRTSLWQTRSSDTLLEIVCFQLPRYKKINTSHVCLPKGVRYPTHLRLTKLVLLCQKSQQILSAPNLKIVLSCAHFQTTKYLITSVNDIEIEHLSLGFVCGKAYVYMPTTIL